MVFARGVITKGTIAVELSSLRHGLHNYNWAGTMLRTVLTDTSKKNSLHAVKTSAANNENISTHPQDFLANLMPLITHHHSAFALYLDTPTPHYFPHD
jgi:hypothetical protein